MARPTQTRINVGAGFQPETRQAPALQVVAPLNVRTGPSGAELLADSLGIALNTALPIAQQKIQERAADSTALGRAAAAANQVDAKRQAEDDSYAVGVKRGLVDRAVVDFKSAARTFFEEEFDKSQGTEALAQSLDSIAKGSLGRFAGDADAARWMTPEVTSEIARITGAHDAELAQQFKDDRVSSASALMRDAIQNRTPIDPEEIMNRLRPILGNSEATKAYVEMVGSLAVENRAPELIEALIPEKWADGTPGPRSTPALNQALNQSRFYAESAARERDGELKDAAKGEADNVRMRATLEALRGIDPTATLADAKLRGLPIQDEDLRSITGFFRSSRDDVREQRLDPVRIAQFRVSLIDTPKEVDTTDLVSFISGNFSQGKDGVFQANGLIDDFISAQNAANKIEANPLAKSYRSNLATRFKPEPFATDAEKDRYFQGLVAFDKEIISSGDADRALAAAETYFGKTPITDIKPSSNLATDVKAFAEGRMSASAFVATHKRAGSAVQIYERIGKDLTREQAEKAIRALTTP